MSEMQNTPKSQQLLESARALIVQHGVRRISVEEICTNANVSKVTFYRYWKNKYDIAEAVIREFFDEALDKFNSILATQPSVEEAIEWIVSFKEKIVRKIGEPLMMELMDEKGKLYDLMNELKTRNMIPFVEFIKERQSTGEIRPDLSPEFIIIISDWARSLMFDERLIALFPDKIALADALNNFVFYGLVSPVPKKGNK